MSITLDGSLGISTPTYNGTVASEYQVPVTGFKNRIINGSMVIDQRNAGAAQTITAGTTPYTADRWIGYFGGGNGTSQRIGTPGAYSLQFTGGAGVSGWQCVQRIEANNIADCASQNVTLSFTVSSTTQTSVGIFYNTPTAQDNFSSLNSTVTITGSAPVTSTPTRLSYTFAMPSTATNGFQFFFQLGSFTSGTFTIANVQLEKGSTATSFDYRPYGTELALCYRYFRTYNANGTMYGVGSSASTTTISRWGLTMDVAMRTGPTITFTSMVGWSAAGGVGGAISVSANTSSINAIECDLTYSSGTATVGLIVKAYANTGSSSVTASAEL